MERYLLGLGSNIRHPVHGAPRRVIDAAAGALGHLGRVRAISPIIDSAPVGPSIRTYANAAAILETSHTPQPLLAEFKRIEAEFGTRRGARWSARVLDLDILLWSGGVWASRALGIPHQLMRDRPFVLGPASRIAGHWKDPITNLSLQHLNARLTKSRPIPR